MGADLKDIEKQRELPRASFWVFTLGNGRQLKLGVGVELLTKISGERAEEFLKGEARSVGNS